MQEQMEMAFMQEGGMKDDGMNRDPVSGNEIPPGSMAKEVRDDIPAMLSEGEYVVPADVVQYFGVKFFEDLRMAAKMGLRDMEKNGRIGGEPIDDDEEELEPNESEVLMEVMQMNSGGVIGMADGGTSASNTAGLKDQDLRDYTLAPTVSSYLTPGALQFQAKAPPKVDMGEPECPEGYVFDKTKNACVPVEPAVTQDTREPRDPVSPHLETKAPWHEEMDWENPEEYYANMFKPKSNMEKIIPMGMAAMAPGPIGAVMAVMAPASIVRNIAEMRASAMMYRAAGNTQLADKLLEQSNAYVKAGGAFVRGLDAMVDSDGSMIFSNLSKSMGGPNVDALMRSGEIDDINVYLNSLSGSERAKFQNYLKDKGYGKKKPKISSSSSSSGPITKPVEPRSGQISRVKPGVKLDTYKGKTGEEARRSARSDVSVAMNERDRGDTAATRAKTAAAIRDMKSASGKDVVIKNRTDSSGKKAGQAGYKSALRERMEKNKSQTNAAKGGLMKKR